MLNSMPDFIQLELFLCRSNSFAEGGTIFYDIKR